MKKSAKNIKKPHFGAILLAVFVVFGFFLRAWKLTTPNFWIDEGFTIMSAQAIFEHGYPLLNSGMIEKKDVLLPYFLQIVYLFGDSPFLLRIIPVLFGTASIVLIYFVGRELFNSNVGLISSFLLAFSYWHIAWSRQVRGYSLLIFFVLAVLFFLARHSKTDRPKHLFFAVGCFVLAVLSKNLAIVLLVPLLWYLFLQEKHKSAGWLAVFGVLFGAGLFFERIFGLFHQESINNFSYYLIGYLWSCFGLLVPLGFLGLVFSLIEKKQKKSIHFFNLVFLAVAMVFVSFFSYVSQGRYLLFASPVLFLYGASLLERIFEKSKKQALFLALAVVFSGIFLFGSMSFLPKDFYQLEVYTPQPDFESAYKEIEKVAEQDSRIVSAYPFLDRIYLGKADYAIEISYTKKSSDSTIFNGKEYYSGAKKLNGIKHLEKLAQKHEVFVVADSMAMERMDKDLWEYIQKRGVLVFATDDRPKQNIAVYLIRAR